jgi:uncharacterized protein (TIGR03067 family)
MSLRFRILAGLLAAALTPWQAAAALPASSTLLGWEAAGRNELLSRFTGARRGADAVATAGDGVVDGKLPSRWSVLTHKNEDGESLLIIGFGVEWVVKDDQISLPRMEGDKLLSGPEGQMFAYKIVPGKGAPVIDLTALSGVDKGKVCRGIFQLKDGVLSICFSPPGQERPTTFDVPRGSGRNLVVLKQTSTL